MNRQEFIEKLRMSLNGRLSQTAVADNVNYYEDYISVEIRKGRTEEDVLASLGDPRLIAKTIIQTNGGAGADMTQSVEYRNMERGQDAYDKTSASYDNFYNTGSDNLPHIFRIPGWLATLIVIIITLLVFAVIFSVLSFLAPVLLAIAAVMLIVKIFRDWLN
ncbi:MAG: DUF1700 domain-containing protein [Bacteroidales bacterium]|nr:DUF1700 domain-containing protein [Lachnoclostridium sp.]MCM1384968.1 DUF1700 domain-containing protein [Lachnoclostridium sp.]MCM1465856.1 DUF1700 domain-containing protein [Bacteroidales bacterium]